MTTAAEWLQTICPALYGLGSGVYTAWLDMADGRMATSAKWGDAIRPQAQAWLAAHLWTRTSGAVAVTNGVAEATPTGPLISEGARDVKRSYGSPVNSKMSAGDQELSTTVYGQQYLQLRRQNPNFGARIIRS